LALVPALAAAGLVASAGSIARHLADPPTRDLAVAQVLVTAWCAGWLALVTSYSGGTWIGDWFGHWQRTLFFLERGPLDIRFNGFDPLPSRPPFANVVVGALIHPTGGGFAAY